MHMPSFSAFDADDDGRISQTELNAARAERQRQRAAQGYPMRGAANAPDFSAIDADGSGGISPEEFARFHGGARRP
jgi:Ca2+-binding EF-hand superfamily protein